MGDETLQPSGGEGVVVVVEGTHFSGLPTYFGKCLAPSTP